MINWPMVELEAVLLKCPMIDISSTHDKLTNGRTGDCLINVAYNWYLTYVW